MRRVSVPFALAGVVMIAAVFTGAGAALATPVTIDTGGAPRLIVMSPDGKTA
jgi:hypothetical protein